MKISIVEASFALLVVSKAEIVGALVFVGLLLLGIIFFVKRKGEDINKEERGEDLNSSEENSLHRKTEDENIEILKRENILLDLKSPQKEEAIKMAGKLLVDGGYVEEGYIQAMLEREKVVSTYIGNGIAIPHGIGSSKDKIKKSGIIVLQFPEGVDFEEDKKAYLVIGIAGKGNDHLKILSNIAASLEDEEIVEKLVETKDVDIIYEAFASN